jgi:hypothetical protein
VKMAHNVARNLLTPRLHKVSATARPSGTLCTARESEMYFPLSPPKLTPMPIPSDMECRVITNTMSAIFRKSTIPR